MPPASSNPRGLTGSPDSQWIRRRAADAPIQTEKLKNIHELESPAKTAVMTSEGTRIKVGHENRERSRGRHAIDRGARRSSFASSTTSAAAVAAGRDFAGGISKDLGRVRRIVSSRMMLNRNQIVSPRAERSSSATIGTLEHTA